MSLLLQKHPVHTCISQACLGVTTSIRHFYLGRPLTSLGYNNRMSCLSVCADAAARLPSRLQTPVTTTSAQVLCWPALEVTSFCLSVQMLQQGFPPDSCDYDKRTGLMLASTRGHIPVVELLLAAGAPVDQLDSFGQTALSEACKFGQEDTITVLRRAGAK